MIYPDNMVTVDSQIKELFDTVILKSMKIQSSIIMKSLKLVNGQHKSLIILLIKISLRILNLIHQ